MRRIPAIAAVVALLVLGACNSDDDGGAIDTSDTSETTTSTADTGAGKATGGGQVEVKGFAFSPPQLSVRVGDKVTWRFADSATHTVTADDGSFDSGGHSSGETFDHTFETAGTFSYHCTIHGSMKGTVAVSG
jgi:plastocyanin